MRRGLRKAVAVAVAAVTLAGCAAPSARTLERRFGYIERKHLPITEAERDLRHRRFTCDPATGTALRCRRVYAGFAVGCVAGLTLRYDETARRVTQIDYGSTSCAGM